MKHVQSQSISKKTDNGRDNIIYSGQNILHDRCRLYSLPYVHVTPFHYLETSTIIALSNQKTYSELSEFNQENDGFITSIHVIHISKNAASNIKR